MDFDTAAAAVLKNSTKCSVFFFANKSSFFTQQIRGSRTRGNYCMTHKLSTRVSTKFPSLTEAKKLTRVTLCKGSFTLAIC